MMDIFKPTGCVAVNDHINKPIPTTLWHYTSFNALLGIVSSKKIWATEYRFLNDREEFSHARKLAQELVEEQSEFIGKEFPARYVLHQTVNLAFNTGHLHDERLRIMVASFSEEGDQLSQWRGYAGNSTGVSIGLDLRAIRPPLETGTTVTFAPCIYKDADKRSLLKTVFAQRLNEIQEWWDSTVKLSSQKSNEIRRNDPLVISQLIASRSKEQEEVIRRSQVNLQFDLLRIAPLLKNESFSEEKEWRLVLPMESIKLPTNHIIEFRSTSNSLVPYIAYPLNKPNQEGPIFCNALILGPSSHPSAELGVNMFLQREHIRTLAKPSKIPYRPM
jgi:hypothetical protein